MFDTHAHLNFSRYKKNVDEVIYRAFDSGVANIVIPGTDIKSSKKAIEIAEKYDGIYAAVGIHPHHAFSINNEQLTINNLISEVESMLSHPKVVAVGEVGMDRHQYGKTKYDNYHVNNDFIKIQQELFTKQIALAIQNNKSLIIHNREATDDIREILTSNWDSQLEKKTVFHCCEPDNRLLAFAKSRHVYIGVDGDITYDKSKQEFIKQVPLEILVIETDSPFLLPEPLKSQKKYPNEPINVLYISDTIASIHNIDSDTVKSITTQNGMKLFNI